MVASGWSGISKNTRTVLLKSFYVPTMAMPGIVWHTPPRNVAKMQKLQETPFLTEKFSFLPIFDPKMAKNGPKVHLSGPYVSPLACPTYKLF